MTPRYQPLAAENWQGRRIRLDGDIAYVPLTLGYEAIIDAADVPLVSRGKWHAKVKLRADGTTRAVYAVTTHREHTGGASSISMHRLIAGTPKNMVTDHVDGNGLNNRRSNLRHATAAQNAFNQRASYSNAAGVKGVYRLRKSDKWQASIRALGVKRYLGTFRCVTAASFAYARASQELHGSFGRPK